MAERHPVKETDGAEATRADVRHILGDLEEATVIEILALQPTVLDLDEAVVWLTGDGDRLDRDRRPLTSGGDLRDRCSRPGGGAAPGALINQGQTAYSHFSVTKA